MNKEDILDQFFKMLYKKPNPKYKSLTNRYMNSIPLDNIEIDLLFMPEDFDKSKSRGFKYILTGVDIASRYKLTHPLTNKSGKDLVEALDSFYTTLTRLSKNKINKISSDSGSEVNNKDVKKWMKDKNIEFKLIPTGHHLSLVENFNNTISRRLFEQMNKEEFDTGQVSKKWIEKLTDVTNDINKLKTPATKLRPIDAVKMNSIEYPKMREITNRDMNLYYPRGTIVFRILDKDEYMDISTLKIKNERRRATDPIWYAKFYEVEQAYKPENEYWYHVLKDYNTNEIYPETYNYWSLQKVPKEYIDAFSDGL